jgi:hemerythrin superfamily protein
MPSKKQSEKQEKSQDAIQLLRQDHDEVRKMFEEFESADEDRKFELAAEICQALTVHATIEEEVFYPQVREAIDAEDLMTEAEIEHDSVKQLIERVQAGEVDEIQLTAMIKVMNEYVNHHVNEEQRKIFPRVRRAELDLEAMGKELLERKMELEAELQDAMTDQADETDEAAGTGGQKGRSRGGMAALDDDADSED